MSSAASEYVEPTTRSMIEVLRATKLSALKCVRGQIYIVDSKATPTVAFQALLSHQIMGAPVLDSTTQKYIGFIDIRDLVRFIVTRYDRAEAIAVVAKRYDASLMKEKDRQQAIASAAAAAVAAPTRLPHQSVVTATDVKFAPYGVAKPVTTTTTATATATAAVPTAASQSQHSHAQSVSDYIDELFITGEAELSSGEWSVAGMARRRPYVELDWDASLLDAAKLMTGESHRICVISPYGNTNTNTGSRDVGTGTGTSVGAGVAPQIMNIVSQSTILAFLNAHSHSNALKLRDEFSSVFDCGTDSLVGILDSDRTIDAFRTMCDADVPGVVIRNASGWYVDRLQNIHIKLFLSRWYSVLNFERPIIDFLKEVRSFEIASRTTPAAPSSAVITTNAPTFGSIIKQLVSTGSHCVYICTRLEDNKTVVPVITVSLGDVLRTIFAHSHLPASERPINKLSPVTPITVPSAATTAAIGRPMIDLPVDSPSPVPSPSPSLQPDSKSNLQTQNQTRAMDNTSTSTSTTPTLVSAFAPSATATATATATGTSPLTTLMDVFGTAASTMPFIAPAMAMGAAPLACAAPHLSPTNN